MKHNIIKSLEHLAYPVANLQFLPGNPQESDVQAIKGVLEEFGQHSPILVNGNPEEGGVVLAGNHRLEAAIALGWTEVAVAWVDEDDKRAQARAITDNRIAELGHVNEALLLEMLNDTVDEYYEVFELVGWDDMEIASFDDTVVAYESEKGYIPPVMNDPATVASTPVSKQSDAPERTDQDIIANGSGDTDNKRAAVIQYTLVFDDAEQQRWWQNFIRWLRSDPGATGETTAEKLIDFLKPQVPV